MECGLKKFCREGDRGARTELKISRMGEMKVSFSRVGDEICWNGVISVEVFTVYSCKF